MKKAIWIFLSAATLIATEVNVVIQKLQSECEQNNTESCINLGALYERGEEGVKQDYKKANELYSKACDLGDNLGCLVLGSLCLVDADYKKAIELFTKVCDSGMSRGCRNVGNMYDGYRGVGRDAKLAKEYFRKACNLGDQLGCDDYKRLSELGY